MSEKTYGQKNESVIYRAVYANDEGIRRAVEEAARTLTPKTGRPRRHSFGFKAVNTRDKNFTKGKVESRRTQLEESVARYLAQLDTADLQEPSEALAAKTTHLKEKLAKLESETQRLAAYEKQVLASPDQQISLTHRSGQSLDGNERARLRRGRLQRAGGGRHRASSDRGTRGDK